MAALGTTMIDAGALAPPPLIQAPPSRPSNRAVEFGASLRRQCAFLATVGGLPITCTAVRQRLPWPVATQLTLIAEELLTRAFLAFEGRPGGRIHVSFGATPTALELTVEHSRPPARMADRQFDRSSKLVWRVVERLGGRLESPRVIGGVRVIITVPRPKQIRGVAHRPIRSSTRREQGRKIHA